MSDSYIKEAAALMDQAKGVLSDGASKIQGMAEGTDIKKLLPYLLAGGVGAAGGAALTGSRKKRSGETRGQYLTRILRNAVVAGGLAGGGSYLAGEGFKKTLGSVDLENPLTGTEGDQGPVAAGTRKLLFGYPAAIAAGATGLGLTVGSKHIGANPGLDSAAERMMAGIKNNSPNGELPVGAENRAAVEMTGKSNPQRLQEILGGDKAVIQEAKRLGINTHDPSKTTELPGILKKILGRDSVNFRRAGHDVASIPSHLMGRTTGRRLGRAGIGGLAAMIPATIGAILTDSPE